MLAALTRMHAKARITTPDRRRVRVVGSVYANATNRGGDPVALLAQFPLERIAYVHVAGGAAHDGLYHDTHTDPVPGEVLPCSGNSAPGTAHWRCYSNGAA